MWHFTRIQNTLPPKFFIDWDSERLRRSQGNPLHFKILHRSISPVMSKQDNKRSGLSRN